jgi:transcription antitermination factor NusG
MGRWIVAVTQSNRERWALENIERQHYVHYCPKLLERVKVGRQLYEMRARPLFPRHVFVWIEDRWHSLLSTYGVRGVITFGERLAVVPERDIERIRAMEDNTGMIVLPSLREGQRVVFKRGALAGQSGIYQGQTSSDRCKVLLAYLGRMVPILVENSLIEVA